MAQVVVPMRCLSRQRWKLLEGEERREKISDMAELFFLPVAGRRPTGTQDVGFPTPPQRVWRLGKHALRHTQHHVDLVEATSKNTLCNAFTAVN